MARSVSVKIPTATVIEMIENKIAELKQNKQTYPERYEAYKAEMRGVLKQFADLINSNLDNEKVYVSTGYNSHSVNFASELAVHIELPKKPEDPDTYHTRNKLEELEKTLRLLKLTEQETITSSTYNSVLDLL